MTNNSAEKMEEASTISYKQDEKKQEFQQLSKEFFQDIIKTHENTTDVSVIDVNITPATVAGDNYASMVYAVEVITSSESGPKKYNFIAKLIPSNAARKQVINIVQVFVKEIAFYTKVIPVFNKFLKGRGLERLLAVPHCFYGFSDCDKDCIILQNLKPLGFSMADRRFGLPLQHVKACVWELGKLHAVSLAMKNCDPKSFETVKEIGMETQFTPFFYETFASSAKANADMHIELLLESEPARKYLDVVQRLCDNYFENIKKLVKPSEPYSVLCHGDCWTNNIMFKYEDDDTTSIKSLMLLDFQLIRYGSPVLDLAYFLYNCTTGALRHAHLQNILVHYHRSVTEALTKMGCEPTVFTFKDLSEQWKKHSLFGFYAALFTLRIVLAKSDNVPDLDMPASDEKDMFNVSTQHLLKERFTEVVLELGESGILSSA